MGNKTPVIVLDTGISGYTIFNQNDWEGESKTIVQSCAAHLGLLHFLNDRIQHGYQHPRDLCRVAFNEIKEQYNKKKFQVDKMIYFAEVSEIHSAIAGFLSEVKTLLDLVVQLAGTEKIVNVAVHGFHKKKNVVGGAFINTLERNASASHKDRAKQIMNLIRRHKTKWIDDVVAVRDLYAHPVGGMGKFMFELKIVEQKGGLILQDIIKPNYDGKDFGHYAQELLPFIERFCGDFLKLVR